MNKKPVCRVLTGPTASGKTELAVRLAIEMGWEILCMDSMQIYRRMDIGTAKPTAEERKRVPHHLLDIAEPTETFTAAEYRDRAEKLTEILHARGKEVLFVGGTGLYLEALMHPMSMGNVQADPELREKLNAVALEENGRERLHRRLEELDPETAKRLHPNDLRRVIRAIEVCTITGKPLSGQQQRTDESPFRWIAVSTAMERQTLYERINRRVDTMIRKGLRREVEALLGSGVPETAQSMQGIGYKEMIPCVQGLITEEDAADRIRKASRNYAKRQMTFLRRLPEIRYADIQAGDAYERIRKMMNEVQA